LFIFITERSRSSVFAEKGSTSRVQNQTKSCLFCAQLTFWRTIRLVVSVFLDFMRQNGMKIKWHGI
jgi:hypothetical protein